MRLLPLTAAIAGTIATVTTASAEEREFIILAEKGKPAPGFDDGSIFNGTNFTSFPTVVVGNGGEVSFYGTTHSPNNRAIWSGPPHALEVIAVDQAPIPGGIEGDVLDIGRMRKIVLCPDGTTVFETGISTGVPDASHGIFSKRPGESFQTVALRNHPVPAIAGATFDPFGWGWCANGEGVVLLDSDLRGAVGNDENRAIFRWQDDVMTVVAQLGDQASGFPAGATYSDFTGSHTPTINAHGDIAFAGKMRGSGAGVPDAHGLWFKPHDAAATDLVYEGRTGIPGLPYEWNWFEYPLMDNDGAIAFEAGVMNQPQGSDFGTHFFYREAGGSLAMLAREKDPALGTVGQFYNSFLFTEPLAGGNGHPAWVAKFGPDANDNQRGLYVRTPGGAIIPVLLEGDPAPGIPGATIQANTAVLEDVCVNAKGALVFKAFIEGAGVDPSNNLALWAGLPGNLQLVVRTGDTVRLTDGAVKGVRDIRHTAHGGAQDGYPTCLNDAGRFVFKLDFAISDGGGEAVFLIDDICDLDGDGLDDLFNEAFAGGTEALPYVESDGGTAYLVFRRLIDPGNLLYQPQRSDALASWVDIGAAVTPHPDQSGLPAGVERARVELAPGPGGDAFGRVEIGLSTSAP